MFTREYSGSPDVAKRIGTAFEHYPRAHALMRARKCATVHSLLRRRAALPLGRQGFGELACLERGVTVVRDDAIFRSEFLSFCKGGTHVTGNGDQELW